VISIDGDPIGEARHTNKKQAAQLASLNFMKAVFPTGTSWNEAVAFVTNKETRKPLTELSK